MFGVALGSLNSTNERWSGEGRVLRDEQRWGTPETIVRKCARWKTPSAISSSTFSKVPEPAPVCWQLLKSSGRSFSPSLEMNCPPRSDPHTLTTETD
jgi:hypothetical protein